MSFKVEISDVASMFIVCKRVKKVPFYYRVNRTQTTTYAHKATLFKTKEEAAAACKAKNDRRKGGHLFRVEPAVKHYVNNWELQYNRYASDGEKLIVKNTLKAFSHVKDYGNSVKASLNAQKQGVVSTLTGEVQRNENRLKDLKTKYETEVAQTQNEINKLNSLIASISGTDFDKEYVEPFTTTTDNVSKVLFGKREQEPTEIEPQTMMILPLRQGV